MTRAAEDRCRDVILGRTGTACEGCRVRSWTDKAHRVARSQGGAWTPGNVLGLCRSCHAWAHANPGHARTVGWILPAHVDPHTDGVFLASSTLSPGWYFLDVDGAPYGYGHPALPLASPAFLPPHFPRRILPPAPITLP